MVISTQQTHLSISAANKFSVERAPESFGCVTCFLRNKSRRGLKGMKRFLFQVDEKERVYGLAGLFVGSLPVTF